MLWLLHQIIILIGKMEQTKKIRHAFRYVVKSRLRLPEGMFRRLIKVEKAFKLLVDHSSDIKDCDTLVYCMMQHDKEFKKATLSHSESTHDLIHYDSDMNWTGPHVEHVEAGYKPSDAAVQEIIDDASDSEWTETKDDSEDSEFY